MIKYKLICKRENYPIIKELLKVNNITLDQESRIILCEFGINYQYDNDLIIFFKQDKISELLKIIKKENYQKLSIIMGKSDNDYVPIRINNIVYFNAYNNEIFANTIDNKQYKIKNKLYELEEILTKCFIRINKSEIVNIKYIVKIIPMFKGKLILKIHGYKETMDISRNYIKKFKERIGM
ncbi:MAG: LytTR family DNA-binding domain-containing protein [Clostridiales bacterium]